MPVAGRQPLFRYEAGDLRQIPLEARYVWEDEPVRRGKGGDYRRTAGRLFKPHSYPTEAYCRRTQVALPLIIPPGWAANYYMEADRRTLLAFLRNRRGPNRSGTGPRVVTAPAWTRRWYPQLSP